MYCTSRLEFWVSNFTVFSLFDRKSTDFGKNEGEISVSINSKLKISTNMIKPTYLSLSCH